MYNIKINSPFQLAEVMHNIWLEFADDVACIADYYTTRELLSCLIMVSNGELDLNEIELHEDMDDEYLLILDDFGLWVYYMKIDDDYMIYDNDIVLVSNSCNMKVLNSNINENCEMLFFSQEDEEECHCGKCDCDNTCHKEEDKEEDKEENEEVKGFTFNVHDDNGSTSYSFYSSDLELVERMRLNLLKIWE